LTQQQERATAARSTALAGAFGVRPARRTLDYPCGEPPAADTARAISAQVQWVRLALPFAPGHINVWAIRDGDGWSLADAGFSDDETVAAWRSLLGAGGPLAGGRVYRVLGTHMHQDHVGMASWLAREHGVALWMTRGEYEAGCAFGREAEGAVPGAHLELYRRAGWDDAALAQHAARYPRADAERLALPRDYQPLAEGVSLRIGEHEWNVVVGTGHSPEHACFYCAGLKLFISGDQVLPRISSNVSVWPDAPDADPLGQWLATLTRLAATIPDDVLVLPAHNEPFRGLHVRLAELRAKRERALARLRTALAEPKRAVDVFGALFARSIAGDVSLLRMATGESLAYLNYLRHRGEIECSLDARGVAWYRWI
jgi:glyoxylase-like metal-dependent hydrolase (beta-lactamase superfamily II)